MIQIQAKFIGKYSLGYIINQSYTLRLRYIQHAYLIFVLPRLCECRLLVRDLSNTSGIKHNCEYSSYESFSKNWLVDLSLLDTTTNEIKEPHFDILRINARNFKLNQLIQ